MVWVGEPKYFSGPRAGIASFYENFNFCIGMLTPTTPDLPLREVCNHNFHCIALYAKEVADVEFINGKQLRPNEISIVDINEKPSEDLQALCLKNGFRYFWKFPEQGLYVL